MDELSERASLSLFKPLPEGADQYPLEYIKTNLALKIREQDGTVWVGICDPQNQELLDSLRRFHKKNVIFKLIESSELAGYLGEKLSAESSDPGRRVADSSEALLLDKLAGDAPIINLVNSIMIEAIRKGSSDIHIEAFADEVFVRYRLDGYLKKVQRIDRDRFQAVASRIKIMANLNIMERRLPQEGRLSVHLGEDEIDVRVSIVPIADGESIVLRLFNKRRELLGLVELGMLKSELNKIRSLSKSSGGLVLVTGPTGSGKTTTLNALLRELNSEEVKIITIEDPIEYVIPGISQIQTNDRIGLTFESILRRVLRQNPDIIMVGEIRDADTAELAIRAALTGHLVFSTLHTNDSVSVVTRLKNMGIEPYLISAVLNGALAQRLVRKICVDCREKYRLNATERRLLARKGLKHRALFRGKGCAACSGTGFRGRSGIFELFRTDGEIETMIAAGAKDSELRDVLVAGGMKTLMDDGLEKAVSGLTSVSEIELVVGT